MLEHEVVQQGRQRGAGQRPGVQQPLDLRVAARHRIPDHDQIRGEPGQPRRIVTLMDGDAGIRENRAHRRIDPCVGAQHLVACGSREQRGIAHRRSADAHEIDLHLDTIPVDFASPRRSQHFAEKRRGGK